MEIEFNPGRVPKSEPSQPAARGNPKPPVEAVSFASTSALEGKLKDLPLLRPGKVEAASGLVADSKYPPDDVLDRIAVLLATPAVP